MDGTKDLIGAIGLSGLLAFSVSLYCLWVLAYSQGGQATIDVNSFGEAWWELYAFPIGIVLGLYGIYRYIRGDKIG